MPLTTSAEPQEFAELLSTFPDPTAAPVIQRRWMTVVVGGRHVSGVFWDTAAPGAVLLHAATTSARAFDAVLRAYGRPAVALDLPGHGRSTWIKTGDYRPRRLAKTLEEAIRSFAPGAPLVAGRGLGALAAVAVAARFPQVTGRLVLIDTLPGAVQTAQEQVPWPWPGPQFASRDAARAWLAEAVPGRTEAAVARETEHEAVQAADGTWSWRHHLGTLPGTGPAAFDDDTLWEQLADLPAPVLVRAERGLLSDDAVARFREQVPQGEVVTVPGAGHRIEADRPEALAEILRTLTGS
jgi:pimeloyl-ACP methyl ester carboxylesterase